MKDSLIWNCLNIIILYVSSWSKFVSIPISAGSLNSIGKDKIDLLSDNLM